MQKPFQMRLITCLLSLAASLTSVCAEEDRSLVESALDLPGTESPSPAPSTVPAKKVSNSTNAASSQGSNSNGSGFSSSASTPFSMMSEPTDRSAPENAKIQAPPIHSVLPYGEGTVPVLGIRYGMKYGKTHTVDPTYRGTPVLPTSVPTVTVGPAYWAPKKKIAVAPVQAPQAVKTPVLSPTVEKNGVELEKREGTPQFSTLNVRFLTIQNFKPTDVVYAYPYPVKPPKPVVVDPMPEGEKQLKDMILSSGYGQRIDYSRPYPFGGYRWVRVFETALKKSGTHVPHTLLTCYPWVNKMFPYVLAEARLMNTIEAERKEKYLKTVADFEHLNAEMESKAASEGLVPIPVKVNSKGIGQASLPAGAWWLTATRRLPGLKFYWQVPIRCSSGDAINVQFTEANALLIHGGW